MKTATLIIELFQFHELSEAAKSRAIEDHSAFLEQEGIEFENDGGELDREYVMPSELETIESIEVNEYFFYKNGKLARTIKFTGKHPLSGSTVYESKGQRVFI